MWRGSSENLLEPAPLDETNNSKQRESKENNTMKTNRILMVTSTIVLLLIAGMFTPPGRVVAQGVGDQILLKMKFAVSGVPGQGQGILQTGEVSNVSAAVATATLTQVVAAPSNANLSTYVRGVVVEKSTGGTGSFTLQYGTGTNCNTGTTVILGPVTNPPIQLYYLGLIVPAGKAVCAQTDAGTTSIRLLYS
jgi:hypothetical protein